MSLTLIRSKLAISQSPPATRRSMRKLYPDIRGSHKNQIKNTRKNLPNFDWMSMKMGPHHRRCLMISHLSIYPNVTFEVVADTWNAPKSCHPQVSPLKWTSFDTYTSVAGSWKPRHLQFIESMRAKWKMSHVPIRLEKLFNSLIQILNNGDKTCEVSEIRGGSLLIGHCFRTAFSPSSIF